MYGCIGYSEVQTVLKLLSPPATNNNISSYVPNKTTDGIATVMYADEIPF